MDKNAESAASLHHRQAQGEFEERRSNKMIAQRHRMNTGNSDSNSSSLVRRKKKENEKKKICSISIECMRESRMQPLENHT